MAEFILAKPIHLLRKIFPKGIDSVVNIAIYARKSRFTDSGESIENQIAMCKEYSVLHFGDENIFEVYNDEGFSGGNTNRPALKKLFTNISAFDILICYRLDRISRNVSDFTDILKILDKEKTSFVSVRENFDTSTPMGRAMIHIASVFAQLERETIAERIRDNKYRLARLGTWQGGALPLGYRSRKIEHFENGKKKSYYTLQIDEEKASIVTRIFELYILYKNFAEVSRQLENEGILSPRGKTFSRSSIKKIIGNPVYASNNIDLYDYFYNVGADIASPKADFDGEHGVIAYLKTSSGRGGNPQSQWIIACSEHKAIISSSDWILANSIITKNQAFRGSSVALFSGYLVCDECGSTLLIKGNRKDKNNLPVFYYRCANSDVSFNGVLLDKSIIKYLSEMPLDKKYECEKYIINSDFADLPNQNNRNIEMEIHNAFSGFFTLEKKEQRKRISLFLKSIVCSKNEIEIIFNKELF